MSDRGYDIAEVVRLTGLEESLVRYYESAYAPLLPAKIVQGTELRFDPRAVEALGRIHRCCAQADGPLDLSALRERIAAAQAPEPPARLGHIVSVTSGKGGVGKSNVALNLAVQLRRLGRRVLLFDGDMGTGNQHILAGIAPGPTLLDCLRKGLRVEEVIQPGPLGIGLVSGGSGYVELANLPDAVRRRFLLELQALASTVDTIVIDTGTGISTTVVEFACCGDQLVVVTTPDITAITDAYGMIKAVARIAPRLPVGVVVNHVPSAAAAREVYNRLDRCASRFLDFGLDYLGPVYRDPAVVRAVARRRPVVLDAPEGRAGRCLRRIAEGLAQRMETLPDPKQAVSPASTGRNTGTERFGNAITILFGNS